MDGQMELHKQKRKSRDPQTYGEGCFKRVKDIDLLGTSVGKQTYLFPSLMLKKKVIKVNHKGAHPEISRRGKNICKG